jgi:hypothetical protein
MIHNTLGGGGVVCEACSFVERLSSFANAKWQINIQYQEKMLRSAIMCSICLCSNQAQLQSLKSVLVNEDPPL